mmetsp:Transcript_24406/g.39064  ORF Transcript_24406/g.39064 Transcript_24406/m.39064 type:complete len:90 (-) Transcript_24406:1-270(-)
MVEFYKRWPNVELRAATSEAWLSSLDVVSCRGHRAMLCDPTSSSVAEAAAADDNKAAVLLECLSEHREERYVIGQGLLPLAIASSFLAG